MSSTEPGVAAPSDPSFVPPGPGHWELDRSHYHGGTSPIVCWLQVAGSEPAFERGFVDLGVPARTLAARFVNGFMYTRLRPLVRPDKPAERLPPAIVLRTMTRLHPEFRRRTRNAARTLRDRPWRRVVADWHARTKPEIVARNLELGAVDVAALDDAALADHVGTVLAYARDCYELHFWLHLYDLGPIGMLLTDAARWGLPSAEVVAALEGASPSTGAAGRALAAIRAEIAAAGEVPASLDDVRRVSPEAAAHLDEYLRLRGDLVFSRYDLDGQTLRELPHVVLTSILGDGVNTGTAAGADEATARTVAARAAALGARLRAQVPEAERARFDERLTEARAAMDLRDDNGPNTAQWPLGILRRALLEVGRRLADGGAVHDPVHVLELERDEVVPLLLGRPGGPGPDALAARAAARLRNRHLTAPPTLGPVEPAPPLALLPDPLRVMIGAVDAVLTQLGMVEQPTTNGPPRARLGGTGVGSATYRGRARRAESAEAAISDMEPGDVLIVPFTTPSYNTVLGIAGAVVTSEGGPLCHAAVLARELGIPAVIGAAGALTDIPDGAEVEVDPIAGTVTVLRAANTAPVPAG